MKKDEKYYTVSHLEELINSIDEKINNIGKDENNVGYSRMIEIENEFKGIAKNIKAIKRNNAKKFCIRNIKIFGRALQGICPYVVCAGLFFGLQTAIYDVPFVRQEQFKIAQHEQIIDYNGVFDDKITYVVPSTRPSNGAYYSTQWEKKDDGKYYRTVRRYYIGNKTIDELKELIKDPNFDFKKAFENDYYYSSRVKTTHEVKDSVSEEELAQGEYLKIVTSYVDYDDVIYIEQSEKEDLFESIFYSFLLVLLFALVFFGRKITTEFNLLEVCKELKDRYKNINVDELIKLLNEKKIKFERVEHQQLALVDPITNEQITIKR